MDTRLTIRKFIVGFVGNSQLDDDDDIFELGYVTSLFAMELVTFVESEFGIAVRNEDLELAHFCSVNALTEFVETRQADSGRAPRSIATTGYAE
jgi:acyl carrier protein